MEGTTSLSYNSSPSPSISLIPTPTSNETIRPSFIPLATSMGTSIERPMTKLDMLQSQ